MTELARPTLGAPAVTALEALVAMAAADGVVLQLEHPAVDDPSSSAGWTAVSAWVRFAGGAGVGVHAHDPALGGDAETPAQEAARAADTAHESVVEWMPGLGRATNWPACPEHPTTHPLQLAAGDDADPRPLWTCPLTGEVVGVLGSAAR